MSFCQTCAHVTWQSEVLANKAVYFIRTGAEGVSDKTCEADITIGEVWALFWLSDSCE